MVHVPQILKVSAKGLKSVALTGVALAQAHPVAAAFTVIAVVGVGLAIYYTKHSKNRKREDDLLHLSHGNKDHSKDENSYFYDPESKSITTDIPTGTASHKKKALRKRHIAQSASASNKNNPLDIQDEKKNTLTKEGDIEIFGNNQNIDNGKACQNDIFNTGKALTGQEKVNDFIRHIPETEFMENGRPADESHSIESIDENSLDLLFNSNSQSYWIDDSFLDLNDIRSESSVGTLLPEQSDWCRACRKNPVNTYTQPCNHRYMCDDCAMRIFTLFKRCKVCRGRIEEITVEES